MVAGLKYSIVFIARETTCPKGSNEELTKSCEINIHGVSIMQLSYWFSGNLYDVLCLFMYPMNNTVFSLASIFMDSKFYTVMLMSIWCLGREKFTLLSTVNHLDRYDSNRSCFGLTMLILKIFGGWKWTTIYMNWRTIFFKWGEHSHFYADLSSYG